jgi:transposase
MRYYTERARPIAEARGKFEENTRFQQDPNRGRHATQRIPFKLNDKEQRELAKREKAFHYMQLTKKREESAAKNAALGLAKKAERTARKKTNKDVDDLADLFGKMGGRRTRRRHRRHRTRRSTRA